MRRYALAVLALTLLLGAENRKTDGTREEKKPVKVEGVVTLDGTPVANATIVLTPLDEDGYPAVGKTDKDGRYQLTTFNRNDGALPGEYVITVAKKTKGGLSKLPAVYGGATTTPLKYVVPSRGPTCISLRSHAARHPLAAKPGLLR